MAVQKLLSSVRLFSQYTWLCHIRIAPELIYFVSHSKNKKNYFIFLDKFTITIYRPTFFNNFVGSESTLYWVYYNMYSNGPLWFGLLLIVVAAMLPDIIIIVITYLRDENKVKKAKEREAEQMRQAQTRQTTQSFVRLTPRAQSRRDRRVRRETSKASIRVFDTPSLRIYNTKVYQTDF